MAMSGGGGSNAGAVRAGGAFVELFTKNNIHAGLRAAERQVAAFARSVNRSAGAAVGGLFDTLAGTAKFGLLGGAGGGLVAGLTATAAAAVVLGKSLSSLQDTARIGEVAQAFGASVESASGLLGVMERAGSGIKESIESITQFGTAITNAVEGKGENAQELFDILKVGAAEFAKVPVTEGVMRLFEALEKVNDPLDKMRALSLAFGTDGMKLLIPMLNRTSAELRRQADLYARSTAEVEQARQATAAYTAATAAVDKAWRAVATAVAPTVERLAGGTEAAAHALAAFLDKNAEGAGAALKQAAAWAEMQARAAGLGDTLGTVAQAGGGVVDAFKAGDLEAAAKIAFKGVEIEWTRLMVAMRGQLAGFWAKGGGFDQFRSGWADAMGVVDDAGNAGARTGLKWLTEPLNGVQGWIDKQLGNVEPGAGGPRKNTQLVYDPKAGWADPQGFWERQGRKWQAADAANADAAAKAAAELQKLEADLKSLRANALAKLITPGLLTALYGGSAPNKGPSTAFGLGAGAIAGGAGGIAALFAGQGAKAAAVDAAAVGKKGAIVGIAGGFAGHGYGSVGRFSEAQLGKQQVNLQQQMLDTLKSIDKKQGQPGPGTWFE